jgi:protein gp37
MGAKTGIAWCDATWSPWWGCFKVSEGCKHCYADTLASRYGHSIWGPASTTPRKMMSENHWRKPLTWNRQCEETGIRMTVFPSMCDPFEHHPMLPEIRRRFWSLINKTPNLTWLILTKRPENIHDIIEHEMPAWRERLPDNLWLGPSVENDENTWRLSYFTDGSVPKGNYFISFEPLIGDVGDLSEYLSCDYEAYGHYLPTGDPVVYEWRPFRWVIIGGESGNDYRPMDIQWVRNIRGQCDATGIEAIFYKQGNGLKPGMNTLLDGELVQKFPAGLKSASKVQVTA